MRTHFCSKHWADTVCIPAEYPEPYPHCELCGLQLPHASLTPHHFHTKVCLDGQDRRRRRVAVQECKLAASARFLINGETLVQVPSFCYLGRIIHEDNSDWPALYHNIKKAQKRWGMVVRILEKDGATLHAKGMFYVAIIQSILLYGVETWTVTPTMMTVLGTFHNRVARQLAGKMAYRVRQTWVYPPLAEALYSVGLAPIQDYVRRRQASIEDYIATRPIMALCHATHPRPGASRAVRWWQQTQVDNSDSDA